MGSGAPDHGEEADVATNLDAAHVDLDDGALAVGVEKSNVLVRRGGHEGALDPPAPGRRAVRHPELGRQQHLAQAAVDLPESKWKKVFV